MEARQHSGRNPGILHLLGAPIAGRAARLNQRIGLIRITSSAPTGRRCRKAFRIMSVRMHGRRGQFTCGEGQGSCVAGHPGHAKSWTWRRSMRSAAFQVAWLLMRFGPYCDPDSARHHRKASRLNHSRPGAGLGLIFPSFMLPRTAGTTGGNMAAPSAFLGRATGPGTLRSHGAGSTAFPAAARPRSTLSIWSQVLA